LDGEQEAQLIALACSQPEERQERWTLQRLSDKLVQVHLVASISRETIRQVLKHNEPEDAGATSSGVSHPRALPSLSERLEEVLTAYIRPYDERRPQICMNETRKKLVSETRVPLPMQPGQTECSDYEYERQGTCNLFVACEPRASQALSAGDRAAHQTGFRALHSRAGGCLLSGCRQARAGHG